MSLPLVSIISPAYNHEGFIASCIASVQQQSYTNWEMIIVNDGSTDSTKTIAEKYATLDDRISVIGQANVGVFRLAETYNKALAIAKGKYIAILEGDDLWSPDKLTIQVPRMENDPSIVLTWGKAELINEDNSVSYYVSPDPARVPPDLLNNIPGGSIIELKLFDAWLPALTIMIRRETLLQAGGFIQSHGMPLVDVPTILSLSLKGRFFFENRVLGQWRIYPTQTTKKYTVEIYSGLYDCVMDFLPKVYIPQDPKFKQIDNYFKQLCLIAYARSGRYKLIRKEYKSARKDYIRAIGYPAAGKMIWRLRAGIGLLMSVLHLDVEWMARLFGKETYSS